jgi:hypothetical protein
VNRARKLKASVVVAAAATLLSGCGFHPGAAAVVGDQVISTKRVDAVAQALCSANAGNSQGQALASRGARQGALRVLIDSELSRQFGEAKGVQANQRMASQALAQNQAGIESLPADEREAFRQALKEYAEGQLIMLEAGRRYLASQGQPTSDQNKDVAAGRRLRGQFAKQIDIKVDPRYGSFDQARGTMQPTSGSLSVPVSQAAADGASPDPSAAWVANLPATQKCG